MKYCVIRKVAFKTPGKKSRIVWAHVIAESEGLALLLVPKPEHERPHAIFIAEENLAERVFESVGPHRFDLETQDVKAAGDKLRMLGQTFLDAEFLRLFRPDEFP
jgi:hypothetical protein